MDNLLWRSSKWASKMIAMLIVCLALCWVIIPFLWAIGNSIKTHTDVFKRGAIIPFLQFTPTLDSWKEVLGDPQTLNCLFSSTLAGGRRPALVLLIRTPAAFTLARFEIKRMKSNDISCWCMTQRVMPT